MFETFRHIAERAQRYPVICRHNQMARPVSVGTRAVTVPKEQYRHRPLVIIEL